MSRMNHFPEPFRVEAAHIKAGKAGKRNDTMKTTLETIIGIIADHLVIGESLLCEDTQLVSIGCDSIDMLEIEIALEEEFNVELEQFSQCKTIGDIAAQVTTLLEL